MKKLLSILTIAIVSTSSISSTTAFTTNQNIKLSNQNEILDSNINKGKKFINTNNNDFKYLNNFIKSTTFLQKNIIDLKIYKKNIYILTNNNLYISNNNGKTYTTIKIISNQNLLSLKIINNNLYINSQNGLYYSNDGINFNKINNIKFNQTILLFKIINNLFYLETYSSNLGQIFNYVSNDGINFNLLNLGTSTNSTKIYIIFNFKSKFYIGTQYGFYYSNNGINSWKKTINNSIQLKDNYKIINNKIYVGTDEGIYISSDGINFNLYSLDNQNITTIESFNNIIYVGTYEGIYISSDDGKTFSEIKTLDDKPIEKITVSNSHIYIQTNINIYESTTSPILFSSIYNFSYIKDNTININFKTIQNNTNITYITNLGSGGFYYEINYDRNIKKINDFKITKISFIKIFNKELFYLLTENNGLWISSDNSGINFNQINKINTKSKIININYINNKIYVATNNGLYISKTYDYSLYSKFFNKLDNPISEGIENNTFNLYYTKQQTINFKSNNSISKYQIDDENKTINTDHTTTKNHTKITLLFNDKNEAYNYPFGDTNNGSVSFYINIINNDYFKNNSKLTYSTNSDINLYQGLIGNQGNINGEEIIATQNKNNISSPAPLNINSYDIDYIDWSKSSYQKGTLDATGINFTKDSSDPIFLPQNGISGLANGVYQATITDLFGHSKKIIWEVGSLNAKGELDPNTNKDITKLTTQLKIIESLSSTNDKVKTALLGKLNNYQTAIDNYIKTINLNYKGFENSVDSQTKKTLKELINDYEKQIQKQFLDSLNAINPDDQSTILFSTTTSKTDQKTIDQAINDFKIKKVNNMTFGQTIQSDLNSLIQKQIEAGVQKNMALWTKLKLNPSSWNFLTDPNVKQDLDKFNQYVVDYNNYINTNFNSWLQKDINDDGLGYLTTTNIANIKAKYTVDYFESHFLKQVDWNPKMLNASKFDNNIDFTKFNTSVQNYINTTFNVKGQLTTDITNAEKGVNLYNHKISDILKYKQKQLPKNKAEISNFDGKGTTYHNWLVQASKDYNTYISNKNQTKATNHTILIATLSSVIGVGLVMLLFFFYKYRWSKKARGIITKSEVLKLYKEGYDITEIVEQQHPELKYLLEENKNENKK